MVRGRLGRPFSARPSPAIWFRRLILLFVAVASLILLPRTEASAQAPAPLVTIATRVVTANSPNPYSTRVGNTTYTATGAGPGYHVVVLTRSKGLTKPALTLVANNTYGLDVTSLNSMIEYINGLDNTVLVVISSIGPTSSINSFQIFFLTIMIQNLGGIGPNYLYGGTMSPTAYSLIGVPGLGAAGGSATQVGKYADPDTDGNIAGVLVPDINKNYAFLYSKFVKIQTSTGPMADTIKVRTIKVGSMAKAFQAPALATGAQGGFHVLIVKRTTIDRIGTDPTVVLLHASYATNSSIGASETHRMAMDLTKFPNGLATGNLIYIIASLGSNPSLNPSSFLDVEAIISVIFQLGGAGDLTFLGSNSYYSIIGIPNATGTLSPEVRSYATPVLSENITALLQQNNIGLFTPGTASATAGATLDLSLLPTALLPPQPWPVAPHGSNAVCPAGAEQCAAYKWISYEVICAGNPDCHNEDIRGQYIDLDVSGSLSIEAGKLSALNYPSQPTSIQPPVPFFSAKAFNAVQTQLEEEIPLVLDVQNLFKNIDIVYSDLALINLSKLSTAFSNVEADVKLAPSANASINVLGVMRDAMMVGSIVAAGVGVPEVLPLLAVGSASLYLDMQFNYAKSGASGNQLVAEESVLFDQIGTAFMSAQSGNGQLETIVLSDWNKLHTIGTNLENGNNMTSGPWYWTPTTATTIEGPLAAAFTVSFYQSLMAAKYQMVVFESVPFSNPSSYSYQTSCNIQTGECFCSGQVYSPPSGDVFDFSGSINMAYSSSDGSYPSNALTTTLFSSTATTPLNLYAPDFFLTQRGWSPIMQTLPQGWSKYLALGTCNGPSGARLPSHGVPNAAAAHHP